ncbi:hypothetical protein AALA24_12720 [Anaerovoracaceae bacterium 42-11]
MMLNVNKVDISGIIVAVANNMITLRQVVAGEIQTDFSLFIPATLRQEVAEMQLKVGDEILVIDAQIYQKGEFRLRVLKANQIMRISTKPEDFFLGEESAKEQFI